MGLHSGGPFGEEDLGGLILGRAPFLWGGGRDRGALVWAYYQNFTVYMLESQKVDSILS